MQCDLIIEGLLDYLELQPKALLAPFGERLSPTKEKTKQQPVYKKTAVKEKQATPPPAIKPPSPPTPEKIIKREEKIAISSNEAPIQRIIESNPGIAWRFERKRKELAKLYVLSEETHPFLIKVQEALKERGVQTEIKPSIEECEGATLLLIPSGWKNHPAYSFHVRGALYKNTPAIALEELSLYEKDPLLKRALWQQLKTALHLT